MSDADGSLWVTFNGALYGWRQMRRELLGRGASFRSTADTEILLHLYREQGDAMLNSLRGMFAFALYDRKRRRLLLARDRVGIKPVYYHDDGSRLVFASELKAVMADPSVPREIDEQALIEYLTFQYVPAPRTIWRNVRKLPAGHSLVCDDRGPRIERYWSIPIERDATRPAEFYVERLRDLLAEAVRLHLDADVPVGAFLSGGIDSSAVASLMAAESARPIQTFSIGFHERDANELDFARRVANHLHADHHEMMVEPSALGLLPRLVWGMDEPFADASIIPAYLLAKAASAQVKVVLSGDGGDETFAGYKTYGAAVRHHRLRGVPWPLRALASAPSWALEPDHPVARKSRRIPMSVFRRHLEAMACFPPSELQLIASDDLWSEARAHDPLTAYGDRYRVLAERAGVVAGLLQLDTYTYLADDVLRKADCSSMLNSLEARCPLLDHHVIEFAARVPVQYKLRGGVAKWILREAVRDLLPAETVARRKQGFNVPLQHWFTNGLGELARSVLLDRDARRRGWLEQRRVERILDRDAPCDGLRAQQVWALVCLELWAQRFVQAPRWVESEIRLDSHPADPPAGGREGV